MKRVSLALGAAALSLVAGQASAQSPQRMSPNDKVFATSAASGGMAEVRLGELAQRNAASPDVKQFGQRMVTDHTKANNQLKSIARRQDITLPTNVDSSDRATEQRLASLKGDAFDAAYMHGMVQDHQKDIAEFQREAGSGQDPALKAFAQNTLPTLQQHLQMAEQVTSAQK